jgi:hypothetical protein
MASATIVTAFFDIGREQNGDGRSIKEYLEWIKKTLELNCQLYVVTEEKFKDFFLQNRPSEYKMHLKIIDFKESYFYKYYNQMKNILDSQEYKNKIAYPNRVECKIPEYNIIQYSKFHYLQMAIEENPYQSDSFFWMDAGASRFFYDIDLKKTYPSNYGLDIIKHNENKFLIQNRQDILYYNLNNDFIWKADNLLIGGMFGGNIKILNTIFEKIENIVVEKMLKQNNINNEQLALALVWNENKDLFCLINNKSANPLIILKVLSL